MDAMSILAGSVQDEAMRYLYLLSLHGSPWALIAAFAAAVTGAAMVGLAARVQRRLTVLALPSSKGSIEPPRSGTGGRPEDGAPQPCGAAAC